MNVIAQIARAVAEALGLINRRHDAKNAADVKARAKAQGEVKADNRMEDAVKNRDVESVRNEIAE